MRRDAPSLSAEPVPFDWLTFGRRARAFERFTDPAGAAMGVNPNSGRWAGADRAADTATALGAAGAENKARGDLRLQGMGLRASAIGMGNGLAGQASGALATGAQIGNSAAGNLTAANNANINTAGIMQSGTKTAMDGFTGQANVLSGLYNSQLSGWKAQNEAASQSNSDLMGAIGTGAGLIFSDEDAKENKEPATGSLKAMRSMPVQEWDYKPGMGDGGRHVGTYAQDFKAATGKGDGRSIPVIDAIGVTMGAVKELDAKVEKLAKGLPAYDRKDGEQVGRGARGIRRGAT
ncbi:tail fiber domain-containing protein [Xanthobacter sp. 126]|uniref:tail fiber domain-containing protein n=1 Tax=Xanthobacter sp. 126 TaxID=1131814 RepID=UPI00045EAAF8|nr:tail fiber domain-containing protein [Xanthobacter sp. 126]